MMPHRGAVLAGGHNIVGVVGAAGPFQPSVTGVVSWESSQRAQVTARSLVSTTAKRQNSLPVHATTPRSKGPGNGEYFLEAALRRAVAVDIGLGHTAQDEVLVCTENVDVPSP